MNSRMQDLMYESGLTAQGCWDQMDDYDRSAIEKFAQLIVQECCTKMALEIMDHYVDDALKNTYKHLGVEE